MCRKKTTKSCMPKSSQYKEGVKTAAGSCGQNHEKNKQRSLCQQGDKDQAGGEGSNWSVRRRIREQSRRSKFLFRKQHRSGLRLTADLSAAGHSCQSRKARHSTAPVCMEKKKKNPVPMIIRVVRHERSRAAS